MRTLHGKIKKIEKLDSRRVLEIELEPSGSSTSATVGTIPGESEMQVGDPVDVYFTPHSPEPGGIVRNPKP